MGAPDSEKIRERTDVMVRAEDSTARRGHVSWSETRTDLIVVALATVLAVTLSLLFLGEKSLWLDESASIYFARDGASMWQKLVHREGNMWFYYVLLHVWLRLGDSEAIARGLSVVFATAAVPLMYGLGRRLFGSRAGAIASLLLASHAYFIHYAQEARGYTLLVFLVTLSSYFLVRAVDEGSRGDWVGHGVAMGLAIHTHFFAALVYLAHLIALSLGGRRAWWRRGFLLSAAIIIAFLVPIVLFQPLVGDQISWVLPLTSRRLFWFFVEIVGGSRPLLLLYVAFWIVALVAVARKRASSYERWHYLLVAAWMMTPVAVAVAFSMLVTPVFVTRYLIASLPPLALLAGAGIARLQPGWLCVPVLLLFLGSSARSLDRWYARAGADDWRGATGYVLSQARTGDAVAFHIFVCKRGFDYYRERWPGISRVTTVELTRETRAGRKLEVQVDPQRLSSLPATYERIWLLLSHDSAQPSERARILSHLDNEFVLQFERDFQNIKVRLYQKRAASAPAPSSSDGALSSLYCRACAILPTCSEAANVGSIVPPIFEKADEIPTHDLHIGVQVHQNRPAGKVRPPAPRHTRLLLPVVAVVRIAEE
jgi:mannosyltransferase